MLDVTGAIRIASNLNNNPGTIRWTGSDFEGRTVSGWVSLTGGGGTDDQNLTGATFSGNTLTIDIENGNSVSIDLSQFDDDTDADADPTNELLTGASLSGTTLNIIDAGGTQSVDLSALNNSGTDDQNLTSATLSGNILTIGIENGNSVTVDLSQFDDDVDADADPTNEFQNLSSTTSGTNRTINISDGTGTTISVADNDNDSSNELQTLSISGSDITLSNGGGTVSVPNDGDWTISGNNQYSAVSGNLGIGTAAPTQKLHLRVSQNTGQAYPLLIQNTAAQNGGGTGSGIGFTNMGADGIRTAIYNERTADYAKGKLHFLMSNTNTTADVNLATDSRMTITSAGNVGIGQTIPVDKLHVAGAIRMVDGNQQAGYIPVSDANGTMTWTDPTTIAAANDGDWTVSGTNVYRATGNVGIGTTSPASTFQVVTSQTGNVSKLHNPGLANGSLVGHEFGKANSVYNMVEFRYNHVSDGNPANWVNLGLWGNANTLNVTGGGNIGIGTFAPEQMLHMKKDNGHAIVKVEATSTSHEARIEFHKWAGTKTAAVGFYPGTPDLRMRTNDGQIIFEPFGTERVRIDEFGNVGIGTNNPDRELIVVGQTETDDLFADRIGVGTTNPYQAKLVVLGTGSPISVSYGYLSSSGNTGTISNQNIAYSIYAEGRIRASEYNAVSDERVKVIEQRTNTGKMLDLVNQLTVTEYSYIDTLAHGNRTKQGFIAQEIEAVYPNAINKSTDFIPNVFQRAEVTDYDEATQMATISLSKSHGLNTADHIKLITEDGDVMADVADATQTTLTVKLEKQVDEVFVYGKQVDDFRAVDYDQVFSIGIAAIQELSDKVEALEVENAALKAELRTEKTTNEARIQVIEEQLGIGLKAQR